MCGRATRKRSQSLCELCGAALSYLSAEFYLAQKCVSGLMKGFCFAFLFLSAKPNSSRATLPAPLLPTNNPLLSFSFFFQYFPPDV